MKRTIIIEILLLFVLAVVVAITWIYWDSIKVLIYYYEKYYYSEGHSLTEVFPQITSNIITAIFTTLGGIVTIITMILIAIKDFPVFKPLFDKVSARKQARAQVKAEKAEADKQNRIAALEAELEELKNN